MKKRWLGLGGFTLAVVALLALWAFLPSGPKHHPEMESGSNNNQIKTVTQSSTTNSSTTARWNQGKDNQLAAFMAKWGAADKQTYAKYNGNSDLVTASGTSYPTGFSAAFVGMRSVSMGWTDTGSGNYDYNVVAVYNYNQPKDLGRTTYAFAFHEGKPVALINQTMEGPDNWTVAKDMTLKSRFVEIVNGK